MHLSAHHLQCLFLYFYAFTVLSLEAKTIDILGAPSLSFSPAPRMNGVKTVEHFMATVARL